MMFIGIMKKLSIAQVELFHLMFLRLFSRQIDATLYSIKGGCNLRFFFNSVRYSEDLDVDIHTIQKQTLEKKVDKILVSSALSNLLLPYGIVGLEHSAPKQTLTTQRWKVQLSVDGSSLPRHTKIEFSRREKALSATLGSVSPFICQQYRLPPTRLSHYPANIAIEQKILALAHRSMTQSRDVFDLYHLLHISSELQIKVASDVLTQADQALGTITYQAYKAQVVSFLTLEEQANFGSQEAWLDMMMLVSNFLHGLMK